MSTSVLDIRRIKTNRARFLYRDRVPVTNQVKIPCIKSNMVAAVTAFNSARLATMADGKTAQKTTLGGLTALAIKS